VTSSALLKENVFHVEAGSLPPWPMNHASKLHLNVSLLYTRLIS